LSSFPSFLEKRCFCFMYLFRKRHYISMISNCIFTTILGSTEVCTF
jgi:hypothetical protein